jgi:drug/metabolite transporter (DMT)-like permease
MQLNDDNPPLSPYLALFGAILAVSTSSIFIRFAQRDASSLVIAAYRLTIATLLIAPLALTRQRAEIKSIARKDWILLGISGIMLAFHFASWITSLEYTTVASSVVLVSTAPLWVAALTPFVLRERISKMALIGMGVALLGGGLVSMAESCSIDPGGMVCEPMGAVFQGRAFWGNLLAMIGAWTVSGYLLIGRRVRAHISLPAYTFIVYGVSAVTLIILALGTQQALFGPFKPLTYILFLALAVVPQILGHSTYNWALRYLPAAFVSVMLLGEPVGSSILAYFILGEQPGVFELAGGLLILIGIGLASKTN